MPKQPTRGDTGTVCTIAGTVGVVVCCAGHALLLAIGVGAVGAAIGGVLRNPLVVVVALLVLAGALVLVISRRRR